MNLSKTFFHFIGYLLLTGICVSSPVFALGVDASYGKRQGDVTFQIGGQTTLDTGESSRSRFPLSELRFQTNTPIVNLSVNHIFKNGWTISASATKNVSSNSGEMQDSDWGLNYYLINRNAFPRDSLDIYSESRLTLDAVDYQIALQKKIDIKSLTHWEIFIGAGFLFQRYEFEAFDTVQSYPSTPQVPVTVLSGKTLTYRYEAKMPFASVNLSRNINSKITGSFTAMYSPWLKINDYDTHILRNKTLTGDSNGWGMKLNVALSYAMMHSMDVYLAASYLKMIANGTQTQKFTDEGEVSELDIGLRNITEQKILTIGFAYHF